MADLAAALPQPYKLMAFAEIDSTNEEAKRQVESGTAMPMLITAGRQTAGRGRRDRNWQSPVGNIAATLLQPLLEPLDQAGQHGFMIALAISAAFDEMSDSAESQLKWPNDVLVEGAKLSGILLEIAYDPAGQPWLISGFGVNVASAPESPHYRTACFKDFVAEAEADTVLLAILEHYFALWDIQSDEGFAPIRDLWLEKAVKLNEEIVARLPNGEVVQGIFRDMTDDGALRLDVNGADRLITAGDIYFPEQAL